jgi:hypothetical protein
MTNSEVGQEPEANATQELSPEQFMNDMDALASYLVGRGLPLLAIGHYRWMARYLTSYFKNSESKTSESMELTASFPFSVTFTVSFRPGEGRLLSPTIILVVVQVFDRLWQLVRSLVVRLAASAILSARDYTRNNAVASAPLIAAIVIVFFTGDSWKILGQGFDWQFGALLGFLLALSILGAADLGNLSSHFSASQADFSAGSGSTSANTLSAKLTRIGHELPAGPKLSRLGAINVTAIYLGIITANLLLIGFLVSGALTLIGVIRINAALTRQLTGGSAQILLRLPGGMVISQELLSLSLTLGGLAILSFTFITLPNRRARSHFASTATSGLRRVLIAFTVYQAGRINEAALTGVSSRSSGDGDSRPATEQAPDGPLWLGRQIGRTQRTARNAISGSSGTRT